MITLSGIHTLVHTILLRWCKSGSNGGGSVAADGGCAITTGFEMKYTHRSPSS